MSGWRIEARTAASRSVSSRRRFRTLPCPTYPEIRLALAGAAQSPACRGEARLHPYRHRGPDRADGAPLLPQDANGRSPRAITRAFRNMSPARLPVPESWCYACCGASTTAPAAALMVATPSLADELHARGFKRLMRWSRGVDTELFRPRKVRRLRPAAGLPLCRPHRGREEPRGRSSTLDLPGRKVVVASGPAARRAQARLTRRAISSAPELARRWRAPTPRPTSSSSRA